MAERVTLADVLQDRQYPVAVKLHDRFKFTIPVEKTTIIEEFKYAIEEVTGIPWQAQELVKAENPNVRSRHVGESLSVACEVLAQFAKCGGVQRFL